jgi:hypothetical protein
MNSKALSDCFVYDGGLGGVNNDDSNLDTEVEVIRDIAASADCTELKCRKNVQNFACQQPELTKNEWKTFGWMCLWKSNLNLLEGKKAGRACVRKTWNHQVLFS